MSAPIDEDSKLIVGQTSKLKGSEITDCELLAMESRGEASMNSRDIRIAKDGVFSGTAAIDLAEVHGTFEGELIARKRLIVYATDRVNGTILYGAMRVEETDIISGNVEMRDAAPARAKVQAVPMPVEANAETASNLEQLPSARGLAGGRAS